MIRCKKLELNLLCTLSGGQSFRWAESDGRWVGVFGHRVWILHQNEDFLYYEVFPKSNDLGHGSLKCEQPLKEGRNAKKLQDRKTKISTGNSDSNNELLLRSYFRLDDLLLEEAYQEWSSKDKHFKTVSTSFQGIRILNQDPVENLFSFICSSNNNISRISSMVERMCSLFGEEITSINGKKYYDFPSIASLAIPDVELQLRSSMFGYRAQYVQQAASKIMELGGREWLEGLKKLSYDEARSQLVSLPGVGTKVADCVCLMSLGFLEAVPVDTHMFKVAAQWYLPSLRCSKTITPRIHKEVGDFFRNLYGPYAGWAHSILFCSSLKVFETESNCLSKGEKNTKRKRS